MNPSPLISVVMPVYNAGPYLRAAIDSVLAQTYASIELICVDDGSSDNSLDVLRSFGTKITLITCEKNRGIAAARNTGVTQARGEYLAFMDADDVWMPHKLALQHVYFDAHPETQLLFTHMQCFVSPELSNEVKRQRACPSQPTPGYLAATACVPMSFFQHVGQFDPRWRVGEFIDWFTRAKTLNVCVAILPEVLLQRRIHATNIGVRERTSLTDYVHIAKEALDRKRAQQHTQT